MVSSNLSTPSTHFGFSSGNLNPRNTLSDRNGQRTHSTRDARANTAQRRLNQAASTHRASSRLNLNLFKPLKNAATALSKGLIAYPGHLLNRIGESLGTSAALGGNACLASLALSEAASLGVGAAAGAAIALPLGLAAGSATFALGTLFSIGDTLTRGLLTCNVFETFFEDMRGTCEASSQIGGGLAAIAAVPVAASATCAAFVGSLTYITPTITVSAFAAGLAVTLPTTLLTAGYDCMRTIKDAYKEARANSTSDHAPPSSGPEYSASEHFENSALNSTPSVPRIEPSAPPIELSAPPIELSAPPIELSAPPIESSAPPIEPPAPPIAPIEPSAPPQALDIEKRPIHRAVEYWLSDLSTRDSIQPDEWMLSMHDESTLSEFLNKIKTTSDAQDSETMALLNNRVKQFLMQFDKNERGFQALSLSKIDNALTTCGDGIAHLLNDLEVLTRIRKAEQSDNPERALKKLAKRVFRLEIVREHAAQKCLALGLNGRSYHESVEVYLGLETALTQRLRLPVTAATVLYDHPSRLTRAEINMIEADARARSNNSTEFNNFLERWSPWVDHQRMHSFDSIDRNRLSPSTRDFAETDVCGISLEPLSDLSDAVELNGQLYSLNALKQWLNQQGTDPINSDRSVSVSDIKRIFDLLSSLKEGDSLESLQP